MEKLRLSKFTNFDFTEPQFDQKSYWGRVRTLFNTQNSFNFFLSNEKVAQAKSLVDELNLEKEKGSTTRQ